MKHFEIKNMNYIMIRRGLGIFMMITALLWLFLYFQNTLKIIYLFCFIAFIFCGLYQMTNGLGLERSWFRTGENYIIVKWTNMINPVQIHDNRILKIVLTRYSIYIRQKSTKQLKLNINFLEREQKKEVYDFFIEYGRTKNLEVVSYF